MKKKFFALFLSFCMLLSLIPANMTLAMETDETSGQTVENEVFDTVDVETEDTSAEPVDEEKNEEVDVADSIDENETGDANSVNIEDGGELISGKEPSVGITTPGAITISPDEGPAYGPPANDEHKGESVFIPAGTFIYSSIDGENRQETEADMTALVTGAAMGKDDVLWFELGEDYSEVGFRFVRAENVEVVEGTDVKNTADGSGQIDSGAPEYQPALSAAPVSLGAAALTPGYVTAKVNVFDWNDGDAKTPLAGVEMYLDVHISTATNNMIIHIGKGTTDANGVANIQVWYNPYNGDCYSLDGGVAGLASVDAWHSGLVPYSADHPEIQVPVYFAYDPDMNHWVNYWSNQWACRNGWRFEINPVDVSKNPFDTSRGKHIRDFVGGSYCQRLSQGGHDDAFLDNPFAVWGPNGVAMEFNCWLKTDKATLTYDTSTIGNASSFTSQTVSGGEYFTAPSVIPVHKTDAAKQFSKWVDAATGLEFDFSKPASGNVTIRPSWTAGASTGIIHINSYLWNHDAYTGVYGTGRTSTPVRELEYVVSYYDINNHNTKYQIASQAVDSSGQTVITLSPETLNQIEAFRQSLPEGHAVVIEANPSISGIGWHTTSSEPHNYAWDYLKLNTQTGQGAGVTGVRVMRVFDDGVWKSGKINGGNNTEVVGRYIYSWNENHTPLLNEDLLTNGFEIAWDCYVTPTMKVSFDLDGGSGSGDYSVRNYKPINSLPEDRNSFLVAKPADPTKAGMTFVGWYKVNNAGVMENNPWDFSNRIVTESMTLKAVYATKQYTVKFSTPGGNQESKFIIGNVPTWSGPNPTKAADAKYTYTFTGWKETTGAHTGSEYTFLDIYDFDHQARPIYESGASTPETIDETFAVTTVYEAQFSAQPIQFTVTYNLNGGSGTFPDQTYNYDSSFNINSNTPTRTGYKFNGWIVSSTTGNWSGTYSAGQTITAHSLYGNTTLKADWTALYNYKLTFNSNTTDSVSNMPENTPETGWIEDITKTMSWTTEPTRDNYTFLGWATSENGGVLIHAGTMSYQMTGTAATLKEQTLYAVWQINERPYTVKYLEQETNKILHEVKTANAQVGSTVTETAPAVSGYEPVSSGTQSITIQADGTNEIIFYYRENEVTITYAVNSAGGGIVTRESETVKVLSGTAAGSTATANPGYKFVGWFSDATCSVKISNSETYTPSKNASGMYEAATYYAKFEEELGSLTINSDGCADANQSFIFHVKSTNLENTSHDKVDLYVTIPGNGSVTIKDLPIGSYIVEEVSSWSWRYQGGSKNATVVDGQKAEVSFINSLINSTWLSGSAYAMNGKSN